MFDVTVRWIDPLLRTMVGDGGSGTAKEILVVRQSGPDQWQMKAWSSSIPVTFATDLGSEAILRDSAPEENEKATTHLCPELVCYRPEPEDPWAAAQRSAPKETEPDLRAAKAESQRLLAGEILQQHIQTVGL